MSSEESKAVDTAPEDAEVDVTMDSEDAPAANGNGPSSNKPTSSRKIAGKGSAKNAKSNAGATASDYKIGDVVLAKMKGYPAWPGIITDPATTSYAVQREKPRTGNYFCVKFLPDADHSWLGPKDLTHLTPKKITEYIEGSGSKKVNGKLYLGYEAAADPKAFLDGLSAPADDDEVDEDEDELVDEEEEEEAVVEDEEEEAAPVDKKRKRASAVSKKETAKEKKAKLQKLSKSKKSKDAVEEDQIAEEEPEAKPASEKKKAPVSKAKSAKTEKPTSTAAAESKEEKASAEADEDPEAQRVKDWRHKLQRAFLSKGVPEASQMESYDSLFKEIEEYSHMTVDYLTHSKIGKVMKRIAALEGIPRDEDLKIKDRASNLMGVWQKILNGSGETAGSGAESSKKEAVNGSPEKTEQVAVLESSEINEKVVADEPKEVTEESKEAANDGPSETEAAAPVTAEVTA